MWDLPAPGIDPMSPTLAGGFLATVPPGKSNKFITEDLNIIFLDCTEWFYFWLELCAWR